MEVDVTTVTALWVKIENVPHSYGMRKYSNPVLGIYEYNWIEQAPLPPASPVHYTNPYSNITYSFGEFPDGQNYPRILGDSNHTALSTQIGNDFITETTGTLWWIEGEINEVYLGDESPANGPLASIDLGTTTNYFERIQADGSVQVVLNERYEPWDAQYYSYFWRFAGHVPAPTPPPLFTDDADSVNFNNLTAGQKSSLTANADQDSFYHALDGHDVITLPDKAHYQLTSPVAWRPLTAFNGDDGNDTFIVPQLSGFPINQTTVQTINGGESDWAPSGAVGAVGDLLKLPGSSGDYVFTVSWGDGTPSWAGTTTTIKSALGTFNVPTVQLVTQQIERVQFDNPIANLVTVTGAANPSEDGNLIEEMARLAWEVYGNHTPSTHPFPWVAPRGNPHAEDARAWQQGYDKDVAAAAVTRGWHAVSAMELGILPGSYSADAEVPHPYGAVHTSSFTSLEYSFDRGLYMARDPGQSKVPFSTTVLRFDNGAFPQADAMVLSGVVDGKKTLSIAFRGTDQLADFADYPDFSKHYEKYKPLIDGIQNYLAHNAVDQVLVSGHSLGAAMVEYFLTEPFLQSVPQNDQQRPSVYAFTFGSPGAEVAPPANLQSQLINFVNTDDLVPMAQEASTSTGQAALKGLLKGMLSLGGVALPGLGLLTGQMVDTLAGDFEQKTRHGATITINSDIYTGLADLGFSEHNIRLYVSEMQKLGLFADDTNSAFKNDPLAQYFRLVTELPYTGGTTRVALGAPIAPQVTFPTSAGYDSAVHSTEADRHVLGNVGKDTIHWLASAFGSLGQGNRKVDGGDSPAPLDTVYFPTKITEWDWQPLNGHWNVFYKGGQVGELYRVKALQFAAGDTLHPNGLVILDGSQPTVQTPASGSLVSGLAAIGSPTFQLVAGFDAADAGDGERTVLGTSQNDIIYFGSGNKQIDAGAGADIVLAKPGSGSAADVITINGGEGADVMTGGPGHVIFVVDNPGDVVASGGGFEFVQASVDYVMPDGIDQLVLFGGAIVAIGNSLNNMIQGNGQGNTLDGGAGADELLGGVGDDTFVIDSAGDSVWEELNEGDDTVETTLASYTLAANVENLVFTDDAPHSGSGNALANGMFGAAGSDTLAGGAGNDVLEGGAGADKLTGQADSDRLVFTAIALADAKAATPLIDWITDFNRGNTGAFNAAEGDRIDVSALVSAAFLAGQQVGSLVRVLSDGTNVRLQVDTDGTANGAGWVNLARFDGLQGGHQLGVLVDGTTSAQLITVLASETTNSQDGGRVEHRVDALNTQPYTDYAISYDALGRVTNQLTNFDDGTRINQVWDVGSQSDWANYYITYDNQSRIVGQVTLNDDASYIVLKWDVANVEDWADYYVTYDGQNRPITQVTHNDDGSRIVFKWDRENQQEWSDYRVTYDSLDRPITQVTNNDDGSRIVFKWDLDDDFSWADYRVTDKQGRSISQVTNNDDGTHQTYGWDADNQGSWSDYVVTTDSQNRATEQTTHYDDGTYTVAKWDVQNQFNWASTTDYYDAEGHHVQQRGVFDNGSTWLA